VNEVLPGVFHWGTFYPRIRQVVHSHYWAPGRTVVDPLLPENPAAVLDALRSGGMERIVLSNRHHWRSSGELREAFGGVPVLCNERGLSEFEGSDREVKGFAFGDELAPGMRGLEFGAICAEDTAVHLEAGNGALLFADGVIVWDGELAFVPDFLLGDPEQDKVKLLDGLRRLLDESRFDSLLFAHGEPRIGDGREALEAFVDRGGRSAPFQD